MGLNKSISEFGYDESVLVIATPRNCGECWLKVKIEDMPDGMIWCPVINQLTDEQERDEGCILIPEPKRRNVSPENTETYMDIYADGWNACLDMLEGKHETN